jgi:hypothetical protein
MKKVGKAAPYVVGGFLLGGPLGAAAGMTGTIAGVSTGAAAGAAAGGYMAAGQADAERAKVGLQETEKQAVAAASRAAVLSEQEGMSAFARQLSDLRRRRGFTASMMGGVGLGSGNTNGKPALG